MLKRRDSQMGFTLVELLISIGIITIISALVLVRYAAFDSSVLLKNAAYEIALALRDAQVYSVSVQGENLEFDRPYGVHFEDDSRNYIFFRDLNDTNSIQYDTSTDEIEKTYTVGGQSIEIFEICTTRTMMGEDCGKNSLDVSFKRPEFKAYFYDGAAGDDITSAVVKVRSSRDVSEVWRVEVGLTGHISVEKE